MVLVGEGEMGGKVGLLWMFFLLLFPVSLTSYAVTSTRHATLADCQSQYNKKCVSVNYETIFCLLLLCCCLSMKG